MHLSIQWYPGHMVKGKRLVQENLGFVDLVVELLDARLPLSSRNPDIDQLLQNRPRLVVLNKADLSDPELNRQWQGWFSKQGIKSLAVSSSTGAGLNGIAVAAQALASEAIEKWVSKGRLPRAARMMIVGIPNVGKSSLINRLAGGKKAITGDKPGVTRQKQWVRLRSDLELLDMPGILWPRFDDQNVGMRLAATGAISDEVFDPQLVAKWLLLWLRANYNDLLISRYTLSTPIPEQGDDLLEMLGRRRGCLMSGGTVDTERAARLVLDDLRSGRLGKISLEKPPEQVVTEGTIMY